MKLVTVSQVAGRVPVTVFRLHDRLNLGNTAELETAAKEACTAGARNMVIDLTEAPSLTSAGIRAIVIVHNMVTEPKHKGKHLKLVSPTPHVREVLDIAGLLEYIDVYETMDEAIAAF
jgi:anti-anti-sigma factor